MSRTYHHSRKWGKRHAVKLGFWHKDEPRWFVHMFNIVPKRRQDARLLTRIATGRTDPDDAAFNLGSRKPHEYYW